MVAKNQEEMAKEIGVGSSTYRLWENGKGASDGPTLLQTDQLNKALRRLLRDAYTDGEAFDAWGWPRPQDMRYGQVAELLRAAGFDVPRQSADARPPAVVLWVHRVREPNLLHGVFALAAAAATRAGLPVRLLLDDVAPDDWDRQWRDELVSRIRGWFEFASGDDAKLSTVLYSAILTSDHLIKRGWSAVVDYLNPETRLLDLLRASKVVSPSAYSTDAEESVLALVRNADSLTADLLRMPLRNWLVFEAEIARMLRDPEVGDRDHVVTLGGADDRVLWETWHRGCGYDLASRVRHIYLRSMPMPSYRMPWREPALSATTNRSALAPYLGHRAGSADYPDLMEWLLKAAVRLPASVNPGFLDGLDPALSDFDALLRAPAGDLQKMAPAVAKAVAEWLAA